MKIGFQVAALLGFALAAPAFAQKPSDDHSAHRAGAQAQSAALSEGEVRKVDKAANKVTLKHGPIPNIDMPAMTMVFVVKDPAMLAKLKAGDKVKFQAQKLGDTYTVTRIEAVR
jgi:Cu(I)/Ag(I) efflux system periplasmic protein CusF